MKLLSSFLASRRKPSTESSSVAVDVAPSSESIAFQMTLQGISYKVSAENIEGNRNCCRANVTISRLAKPTWECERNRLDLILKTHNGWHDNADWYDSYIIEEMEKKGLLAHGEYSNIQDCLSKLRRLVRASMEHETFD